MRSRAISPPCTCESILVPTLKALLWANSQGADFGRHIEVAKGCLPASCACWQCPHSLQRILRLLHMHITPVWAGPNSSPLSS